MNTYQPGDDVTPPVMSPIVQSYIAGLQDSDHGKCHIQCQYSVIYQMM